MAKRLKAVPDISKQYQAYINSSPGFHPDTKDPRALKDENLIFSKSHMRCEPREHNEVVQRLKLFQIAINAKIAQLLFNPVWQSHGPATQEEHRAAPRTFLKTVQEVLCHPCETMAFDPEELSEEDEKDALNNIIIDPRKISDTLLENLGLPEFRPPKGTSQVEKLSYRAQAINPIKGMLASLESLSSPGQSRKNERYFRLMRISEGRNKGHLIGTQMIAGEKKLFKTELNGGHRRLHHIEQGYQQEIEKLTSIRVTLERVRDNLSYWEDIKRTGRLDELKLALAEIVDSLEHVQARPKRTMKEKIEKALTLKDSTNRPNPSISMYHLTQAINYLGYRLEDIGEIWSYLGRDKSKVLQQLSAQRMPFNYFVEQVEQNCRQLKILRNHPPLTVEERQKIVENLSNLRFSLARVEFEPYLSHAQVALRQIDEIIYELQNTHQPPRDKFQDLYLNTKVVQIYDHLQDFLLKLAQNPDGQTARTLEADLNALSSLLKVSKYIPDTARVEHYPIFREINLMLVELKLELKQAIQKAEPEAKPVPQRPNLEWIIEQVETRIPAVGKFLRKVKNHVDQKLGIVEQKQPVQTSSIDLTETVQSMSKKIKAFSSSQLSAV